MHQADLRIEMIDPSIKYMYISKVGYGSLFIIQSKIPNKRKSKSNLVSRMVQQLLAWLNQLHLGMSLKCSVVMDFQHHRFPRFPAYKTWHRSKSLTQNVYSDLA